VGSHLGGAAAEFEERDESKWKLKGQYHLHTYIHIYIYEEKRWMIS